MRSTFATGSTFCTTVESPITVRWRTYCPVPPAPTLPTPSSTMRLKRGALALPAKAKAMRPHIVWTIFRKEITEALRDRVTLLVLVGLPLVTYPLAFVMTSQVTEHRARAEDRRVSTVAVRGVGAAPLLDWLAPTNNRFKLAPWQGIPASLRGELEAGRMPPGPLPFPRPELRLGLGRITTQTPTEPE